ncbi:MAG: FprA family A-type flavoprotein [Chloroflexota bacterium]
MRPRQLTPGVFLLGAVDWDRRLFDTLVPIPEGTSYNSYLVRGSQQTALLDAVDPVMWPVLARQLDEVESLDYLVAHHAEQDHSGSIEAVLARFPQAKVVCTPKAKAMLIDHLGLADAIFMTVDDGQTISLGDKTLQCIHAPWVHWPETMITYLQEDKYLFSCDLFGAHQATSDIYADPRAVYEPAKRYYAEIMMPLRAPIQKNLAKIEKLDLAAIAPSHGPVYAEPKFILDAYRDWVSGEPKNLAVIAYTSMHGSTKTLIDHLVGALVDRGVRVEQFALETIDIGRLATALVDASTLIVGTPTVLGGAHPLAAHAAFLANALRPKAKTFAIVGSYGWGGKTEEQLTQLLSALKVEVLPSVMCKGMPRAADLASIDRLANDIAVRHEGIKA